MTTVVRVTGDPEALELDLPREYADYYTLSPYVSKAGSGYEMLVRLVNPDDDPEKKISRIHAAHGSDGRRFAVDRRPIIAPGNAGDDDDLGCEDPTVVRAGEERIIFYSGYGGARKRSTMLRAASDDLRVAAKRGRAFDDPLFENPKEAALIPVPTGFQMFFEYALDGASRIGEARARTLAGPWDVAASLLPQRPGNFDAWHLSPACAVRLTDGTHVLLYNGSTKETQWRIGWARISGDGRTLLDRCDESIVGTFGLAPGDTDIAFAASCVVESPGEVALYYVISDRRLYRRQLFVEGATNGS